MLKKAVEWGVIERAPSIQLLKVQGASFDFFDFHEFEQLVGAAKRVNDDRTHLIVLLAGEAGLRSGRLIIRSYWWDTTHVIEPNPVCDARFDIACWP